MTSKTKKSKQSTRLEHGKDGTPWIVDEHGNKIKKVRKKVRRRASIGYTGEMENSQTSLDFATANSMSGFDRDDSVSEYDASGKKMTSFRTVATETSTSHHSSSHKGPRSVDEFRSPKTKTPKKSKKSKSLKSVGDDQWWHIDDDIKERRIVKKSSSQDRLNQTDNGCSSSVMTPMTKKKKKKTVSKSKSVRHVSNSSNSQDPSGDYDSGPDSPHAGGTVNTTGTGSIRPKPRRLKSQSDMVIEGNNSGGDLDMLMSQSVHEHIRQPSSEKKPKLQKKSTLGKIGKKLGKSCKSLALSTKNMNLSNHGPVEPSYSRDSSPSRSNHSGKSGRTKPLPKDIKEIDGVLWRVDEYGNKLNKVRRKSKGNLTDYTSGDESHLTSSTQGTQDFNYSNKSMPTWSSDDNSGASFSDRQRRRGQRRNSLGSQGAGSVASGENSIYVDLNDSHTYTSTPKSQRSRSMDLATSDSQTSTPRRGSAPGTPLRQNKQSNKTDVLVQNLQHRLKNSEKEIARLCRVTMDQQDKMADNQIQMKTLRDKLKHTNHDKQALIMEVDQLKLSLEKRKSLSNKSLDMSGGASNKDLMEQICDLEDDKEVLEKQLNSEKAHSKLRMEQKEEEVRFLQEELERMRSEQGDKQFAYMQKISVADEDESISFNSSKSPRRHGNSMQFVGKILGNHLKDKAETEVALQKEEIKNLQARVFQLQQSNEKLTKELKQATLEIKDDDDEDIRFAKEAAMKAASLSQRDVGRKDLKSNFMSLSMRRHRSGSDADDQSCLSLSFRGGVGDCVRNAGRSTDPLSQSFRHNRPAGLY